MNRPSQVCVTLTCPTGDELLAAHARQLAAGVTLVEWRLDHLREPLDVAALVARRPGPTIVTVRRPADGGQWSGDEAERQGWLQAAVRAGVEYVDLEPDVAHSWTRTGKTKRIVSHHDFTETPARLEALHAELNAGDADVVKLATLANSIHDVTRMLRLVRNSSVSTVGLCMGEIGMPSRVLGARVGVPWSYAAPDGGAPPAPGQIAARVMIERYRYDQIHAETPVYGVIGDPIGHSLSPLIHNAALIERGLPGVYLPFRVSANDVETFLTDAPELGIRGLSVTIPHKEAVLTRVSDAEAAVTAIGACNTLVFNGNQVHGYNTDQRAAIESLERALAESNNKRSPLAGKRALVLGAGGAARAIVHGLRIHEAEVLVASRTFQRARELAEPLGGTTLPWDARHEPTVDIVVNCTPLGMQPNLDSTPYDAAAWRTGVVAFDTVYTPELTRFLREAEQAGCRLVTGVQMFLRQAQAQFRLFTGQEIGEPFLRTVLEHHASAR